MWHTMRIHIYFIYTVYMIYSTSTTTIVSVYLYYMKQLGMNHLCRMNDRSATAANVRFVHVYVSALFDAHPHSNALGGLSFMFGCIHPAIPMRYDRILWYI